MLQSFWGKRVDGKEYRRPGTLAGDREAKRTDFQGSLDDEENARLVDSFSSDSPSSFRNRNGSTPRRSQAKVVISEEESDDKRKIHGRRMSSFPLRRLDVSCQICRQRYPVLCSRASTFLLCASFIIWIFCVFLEQGTDSVFQNWGPFVNQNRPAGEINTHDQNAAGGKKAGALTKAKRRRKENALLPGCVRSDWQTKSFPNCNDIHDIDLPSIKKRKREKHHGKKEVLGNIAYGFWRDVWAVDPRAFMEKPAILKIMKNEHDVDDRNFDRHRRDALAMERLTSSPYVVDIYGFCGNTVLTEFLPVTLEEIIYWDDCPIDADCPTRETEEGRLRLALDMARGLKAAHEIPGGPIVHADIHAGQFLVRDDGSVALNDFNRCRFMAHDNSTGQSCTFLISSAPGNARSPEEYKKEELDEKLDVYSLANILCGIFVEADPWGHLSERVVKAQVMNGTKPHIPSEYQRPGSTDKALADLTYRAYALDPKDRISASELVAELETLMAKFDHS